MEIVKAFGFIPKPFLYIPHIFTRDDSGMASESRPHKQSLVVFTKVNVDRDFFQRIRQSPTLGGGVPEEKLAKVQVPCMEHLTVVRLGDNAGAEPRQLVEDVHKGKVVEWYVRGFGNPPNLLFVRVREKVVVCVLHQLFERADRAIAQEDPRDFFHHPNHALHLVRIRGNHTSITLVIGEV